MTDEKILIYGITGMLGTRIQELLAKKFKIIGPPHSHLDLLNRRQVRENIKDVGPSQIIYTAGLTKVDHAQTHPKDAYLLNAEAVEYICQAAKPLGIPVHYISTDAVFDGTLKKRPYRENDKTNPVSVYGKSKLEGEKKVLVSSPKNSVIRTIMIYTAFFPHKKDFARLAYETLKRGEKFEGIADQVINPTFVDDIVFAIEKILRVRANGIFHVAATSYTTNLGFTEKIAKTFKFDKNLIQKVSFDEFFQDKPAPRTRYTWLDTTKFQKKFGGNILHSIDRCLALFKKQIEKLDSQPVDL